MTATDRTHATSTLLRLVGTIAGVAAAVLLGWALASPAAAVPAHPGTFGVEQPDGTTFQARLYGDEWSNGTETGRGHTILQGRNGWWRYAVKADDGSLRPSEAIVGQDAPPARRHLRDATDQRVGERMKNRERQTIDGVDVAEGVGGPQEAPSLGTEKSVVILTQFPDQGNLGSTPAQWNNAFFGPGKSVRDYYEKASGGLFSLTPAAESSGTANDGVIGWVTADMNHPNGDRNLRQATTRAAIVAADPWINYAAYDTNGDGEVSNKELHITVIVAGQEGSCCAAWGKSVWGHAWSIAPAQTPNLDGKWVGNWGYTQFGEMHGNHMATLGIMAHEIGHDLGLPDLYDADDGTITSDGVGVWSLMGYGSWLGLPGDTYGVQGGQTPPLPDAWSRWHKGWITPHQVTGTQARNLDPATSNTGNVAVQLLDNPGGPDDWTWNGAGVGEYFLVENRQQVPGSYDASLPGSGLLVLHVRENRGNNLTDTDRLIDVEEADGLRELDSYADYDQGDAGDLFPGSSNNRSFTSATNPNSNLVSGAASGVSITGVSNSGSPMSATFTAPGGGTTTPPANDSFGTAETINARVFDAALDTSAATIEAGEFAQTNCPLGRTVWYRYTPNRDVRMKLDTVGSTFDTVLNVWRGTTLAGLTADRCNDDDPAGGTTSAIQEFVAQAGQTYYVQIGGYYNEGAGTVDKGALQFHARIRPVNDDFGAAQPLAGGTGTSTGNNQNASKETGEPSHAGNTGGSSIWWSWTAPATGTATFDTINSGVADTLLGVYTGGTVGALTPVAANDDIDGANNRKSRVTFDTVAGTTYRIAVDGYGDAAANRGEVTLNWSTAQPPPAQADLSVDNSVQRTGHTATYTITVSNGGPAAAPVTLVDTLSAKVQHVSTTTSRGTCSGTATVTCTLGSMASGATATVVVTADITGTGQVANAAQVSSTVADPNTANNSDSADLTVEAQPRDVTLDLEPIDLVGHRFGYELTATRSGPADPAGVTVDFAQPPMVDVAALPTGCASGPAPDTIRCNLGTVTTGVPVTIDLEVLPRTAGPHTAEALLVSADDVPAGNVGTAIAGTVVVCDNDPTNGSDVVVGTDDDEVLCGLAGDDHITGNGGDDLIFGGDGIDTASYASAPAPMIVNLNFQTLDSETAWPAGANISDGNDFLTGFEAVEGTAFADQLLGTASGKETLNGLGGKDLLYGYGKPDVLFGGAGKDQLYGGGGKDSLYGQGGRDTLNGGGGRDYCRDKSDTRSSCER